jgi:galactitol-specific phosphotransferase system IIC component
MSLALLIARAIVAMPQVLKLFIQVSEAISKEARERADTQRHTAHRDLIDSLRLSDESDRKPGA